MNAPQKQVATQTAKATNEIKPGRQKPYSSVDEHVGGLVQLQQSFGNQLVQRRASSCPALSACPTGGLCHPCPYRVQKKSYVSEPGDEYEQEADRVAEMVMQKQVSNRATFFGSRQAPVPQIQRMCAECEKERDDDEDEIIQRKEASLTQAPMMVQRQMDEGAMDAVTESAPAEMPDAPVPETSEPVATEELGAPAAEPRVPEPAVAEPEAPAEAPTEAPATALLVEDSVEEVGPGQMKKSEYLTEVRAAVCSTVEAMIAPTGRSTDNCPYLEFIFSYFAGRSVEYLNQTLGQFIPEASGVASARETIPIITERVSQSTAVWLATGQITGLPENVPTSLTGAALGAGGEGANPGGRISFKAKVGGARAAHDPRAIQAQLGSGAPLNGGLRSRMESAFGHDFSRVRVHTDSKAASLSSGLNARAFTIGSDVAFGTSEYQPGTLAGDALIAHELAHVVQQGGAISSGRLKKGGAGYNATEEDADESAVGAMVSIWRGAQGGATNITRNAVPRLRTGLTLQRCDKKESRGKCQIKSGPTYTPSGTIKATKSGGAKTATFSMFAEFEKDTSKGLDPSCCEIRQYILWTKAADIPNHAGFKPATDYSDNTWYEDRDSVGKRYGHRTGPYSECITVNHYEDKAGTMDCNKGEIFKGRDDPMDGSGAKTGEWRFQLKVVDACGGEKDVGTAASVNVDWNV